MAGQDKFYSNSDMEDFVYFNDVLFATLKKAYEKFITKDADAAVIEFVRNEEARTLRLIDKQKHSVILTLFFLTLTMGISL